jgi:eukaryotic-like serine/threonine-protein kinase
VSAQVYLLAPSRVSPAASRTAHPAVVWGIALVAAAHVGYLALLFTSDLLRISPIGFAGRFTAGSMIVADVQPGSTAALSGLQVGDRVTRANGQTINSRMDWQRVRVNLNPVAALELEVQRGGRAQTLQVPLASESFASMPGARPALLGFRLAQVVTLALAILVAFRRQSHPSALLGALLLGSIATLSLVLPMRMAVFWRALPAAFGALLWIPAAVSCAVGPLLFAFFATFPRRLWSRWHLGVALLPAALVVGWSVYTTYEITRPSGGPIVLPDWTVWVFAVNVTYAVGAIALLLAHRRAAESLTDQRRIRVLGAGMVIGVIAGAGAVAGYWRNPDADFFASRALAVLSLVFLAVPASFAYAILRHRLFDLSLIVRQGVRYALARRLFAALIPVLGALLLADVVLHHREPLLVGLQSRWWWYTLVGAALVFARSRRERWLKSLDRRFFRERYDAQRLLKSIAEQISRASSFDAIAPLVVAQVDEALHPGFVDVLRHSPGQTHFMPVTRDTPEHVSTPLPSSFTVISLLSVLGQPLALSLGDTAWVRHQLPIDERAVLSERGIELLVPIVTQVSAGKPVALLVLGPRRSEEPYNEEDLDLLGTIAHALGLLLDRPATDAEPAGLAECDTCGRCFDSTTGVCAHDSQRLTPVRGARILNGRYRLDRRLGRGGMGAVYAAVDEALERPVAVKVIRDDLVGSIDLNARFRHEARAAAGFAHPHVVRVYDFGVDRDGRAFLVMELLDGQTLRQRLSARQPLERVEVMRILRGVCSAVSAAHTQGLVHRDLKPENIFLQRHDDGDLPKVLDFGLAKAFDARWAHDRSEGTDAGVLVGTLDYMAPEQVAGDLVCPAWDIWALGVIAHEMLTGHHPFRRSLVFDSVEAITTDGAHGMAHTQLPAAVTALLSSALSSQPAPRPKDALDFLRAFEQVL